jgi:SAM-dependent methyltransferase
LADRSLAAAPPHRSSSPPIERRGFYARTLDKLLEEGLIRRDMSVLVVCGGRSDGEVFQELGFRSVTISNLDAADEVESLPFRFSVQDAEDLTYDDASFDVVAVSAGLHHCRSPHRALLEMYRVARAAVFVLESRDSRLMRAAVRLGFGDEYELTAVAAHGFESGGVRNTNVPNYVYRWTEREVEKTIASNAPEARHRIRFFHELELPYSVLDQRRNRLWGTAARILSPPLSFVAKVAPGQANLFAFLVCKPELPGDLQPWMTVEQGEVTVDEAWIKERTVPRQETSHDG